MAIPITLGIVMAIALIVVVSLLTGGSVNSTSPFTKNVLDGRQLGHLTLPGLHGGRISAPWESGHPAIVTFFASWCGPCAEELPRVARFAATKDLGNVRILGIDYNDSAGAGRAFAARAKVAFPVGVDATSQTTAAFELGALPDTYFVRADGTVAEVVQGPVTNRQLRVGLAELR